MNVTQVHSTAAHMYNNKQAHKYFTGVKEPASAATKSNGVKKRILKAKT